MFSAVIRMFICFVIIYLISMFKIIPKILRFNIHFHFEGIAQLCDSSIISIVPFSATIKLCDLIASIIITSTSFTPSIPITTSITIHLFISPFLLSHYSSLILRISFPTTSLPSFSAATVRSIKGFPHIGRVPASLKEYTASPANSLMSTSISG